MSQAHFGKPSDFYVQYEDRAAYEAEAFRRGTNDIDPTLYWKEADFHTESQARRFQASHPGATVHQRFGFEQTAPGMWEWDERVLRD